MSHQSLKDLTNVTGSPSDGQILKFTSNTWSPASEGGDPAPCLEIWGTGSTIDGKSAHPLFVGSGGYVIQNGIAASRVSKKSSLSSYTFNSNWDDDTYFITPSASAKYMLIVHYFGYYASTSYSSRTLSRGLGHSDEAPAIKGDMLTGGGDYKYVASEEPSNNFTIAGGNQWDQWRNSYSPLSGSSRRYVWIKDKYEFTVNTSTSGRAFSPIFSHLYNHSSASASHSFKGDGGYGSNNIVLAHKHVKLIQLA